MKVLNDYEEKIAIESTKFEELDDQMQNKSKEDQQKF